MPQVRTGYACPSCTRETGETNEVLADSNKLVCSKHPGRHIWLDSDEFLSAKSIIAFAQKKQAAAPQTNHTSINVSVPVNTANVLLAKYGDKMNATIAGICQVLAEGETLVLSDSDVQRMQQFLKEKPKNGSHLVGMLFSMQSQINEAKQAAEAAGKDLAAYQGMAPGRVVIDLGQFYESAKIRAESEKMPTPLFIERAVKNGLENNWF